MTTRLHELERQRELVRQHLAWLDREIAQHRATTVVPGDSAATAAFTDTAASLDPAAASLTRTGTDSGATLASAATAPGPPPSTALSRGAASPLRPTLSPATSLSPVDANSADELLSRYAPDERLDPKAARSGCLLALGLTFLVFAGSLIAVYFAFYAQR